MSEKKKPRGKPFESGDARRNAHGQRNAAAVATAAQIRALYIAVLNEVEGAGAVEADGQHSNLERVVRRHVASALAGSGAARETMLDRIWGRSLQPIEHAGADGAALAIVFREVQTPAKY